MFNPRSAAKKLEWEARILQQRESGLSIERWCRQNKITSCSFHYWKDRLFSKSELTSSSFAELPEDQGSGIAIEYQGMRVLIEKSFDPDTLKWRLAALKSFLC
jgi:hypothetical protein